jgi:hypothetical protein
MLMGAGPGGGFVPMGSPGGITFARAGAEALLRMLLGATFMGALIGASFGAFTGVGAVYAARLEGSRG